MVNLPEKFVSLTTLRATFEPQCPRSIQMVGIIYWLREWHRLQEYGRPVLTLVQQPPPQAYRRIATLADPLTT